MSFQNRKLKHPNLEAYLTVDKKAELVKIKEEVATPLCSASSIGRADKYNVRLRPTAAGAPAGVTRLNNESSRFLDGYWAG